MSHWYRLALIWLSIWATTTLLCLTLHAPEYVTVGIGIGGCYQAPLWLWAGLWFAKHDREREERLRKIYGRHWHA